MQFFCWLLLSYNVGLQHEIAASVKQGGQQQHGENQRIARIIFNYSDATKVRDFLLVHKFCGVIFFKKKGGCVISA